MVEDDAVNGIQQAAFAIYAQRTRLNNAFAALENALSILKPGMKLMSNGAIIDPSLPAGQQIVAYIPNAGTVPVEPTHVQEPPKSWEERVQASVMEPVVQASVMEPVAEEVKEQVNHTENRAMVATFILANGVTRPSKIDERFLHEPYNWSIRQLNDYIRELRDEKVIKRERDGRLVHKDFSPKVTSNEPKQEPSKGSGTRRDTAGTVAVSDDRVHYRHAYKVDGETPAPIALCGFPRKEAVNVSRGDCPKCVEVARKEELTTNEAVKEPAPKAPATTTAPASAESSAPVVASTDAAYGLARSSKPRDAMRSSQREAEEQMDAIVLWAQERGELFDPLTCMKELDLTKHVVGRAFRALVERGVFELHPNYAGKDFIPDWLAEERKGKGGRGTKAYRLPKADPVPSTQETVRETKPLRDATTQLIDRELTPKPAPVLDLAKLVAPTLEQVRDAAIELREPTLGALLEKLNKSNDRMMRRAVREHMAALVNKGSFVDGENEGVQGVSWRYVPPTDAGAAARYDRVRKPTNTETVATAASGSSGDAPSGRRPNAGNKEVNAIINAACRKWGEDAVQFLAKHIRVKLPDGSNVTIAHTPNQRGLLRDKAKLRKAGLALA